MSEIAERYRTVAGQMTQVASAVPADAWDMPAPCEGWVARDVIRHLVEWIPAFLRSGADVDLPEGVHRMFEGMEPYDEMLRASGQYGPRVEVPIDADEQTKLIAFMGRQP